MCSTRKLHDIAALRTQWSSGLSTFTDCLYWIHLALKFTHVGEATFAIKKERKMNTWQMREVQLQQGGGPTTMNSL